MCAYHGIEKSEDDEEEEEEVEEHEDESVNARRERVPVRVAPKLGIRAEVFEQGEDWIPVVATKRQDAVLRARAEVGIGQPAKRELDDAISVPLVPRIDLDLPRAFAEVFGPDGIYIPDDANPADSVAPPWQSAEDIGVLGEETFTEMIAEFGSQARSGETAGNRFFEDIAWAFGLMFTANAVAHLWQTYNARGGGPGRPLVNKNPNPPSKYPLRQPARPNKIPKAAPQPQRVPSRVPVGSGIGSRGAGSGGRGGYGGLFFRDTRFLPGGPLRQADFDSLFLSRIQIPSSVVEEGGLTSD